MVTWNDFPDMPDGGGTTTAPAPAAPIRRPATRPAATMPAPTMPAPVASAAAAPVAPMTWDDFPDAPATPTPSAAPAAIAPAPAATATTPARSRSFDDFPDATPAGADPWAAFPDAPGQPSLPAFDFDALAARLPASIELFDAGAAPEAGASRADAERRVRLLTWLADNSPRNILPGGADEATVGRVMREQMTNRPPDELLGADPAERSHWERQVRARFFHTPTPVPGHVENLKNRLKRGLFVAAPAAQGALNIAGTAANAIGAESVGGAMRGTAEQMGQVNEQFHERNPVRDFSFADPSSWPGAVVEAAPLTLATMGAGQLVAHGARALGATARAARIAGIGTAMGIAGTVEGSQAQNETIEQLRRVKGQLTESDHRTAATVGLAVGTINALLEKVPAQFFIGGEATKRTIVGRLAGGMIREGVTEGAQGFTGRVGPEGAAKGFGSVDYGAAAFGALEDAFIGALAAAPYAAADEPGYVQRIENEMVGRGHEPEQVRAFLAEQFQQEAPAAPVDAEAVAERALDVHAGRTPAAAPEARQDAPQATAPPATPAAAQDDPWARFADAVDDAASPAPRTAPETGVLSNEPTVSSPSSGSTTGRPPRRPAGRPNDELLTPGEGRGEGETAPRPTPSAQPERGEGSPAPTPQNDPWSQFPDAPEQGQATGETPMPPTGFRTSQGSSYTWDGTASQRTKTPHAGHDPRDVGLKPKSERTVFVEPDVAQRVGMHGQLNREARPTVSIDGDQLVLTRKYGLGYTRTHRQTFPFTTQPEVGKAPVELWASGTFHPGNPIVEIGDAPAAPQQLSAPPTHERPAPVRPTPAAPAHSAAPGVPGEGASIPGESRGEGDSVRAPFSPQPAPVMETAPVEVEGQFAIPGTENAVRNQQQVEQIGTRLRAEYPSLRRNRDGAIEVSRQMHAAVAAALPKIDTTQAGWIDEVRDEVATIPALQRGGPIAEDVLPSDNLIQRVVTNVRARIPAPVSNPPVESSGTLGVADEQEPDRQAQSTVPPAPVEGVGESATERLGPDGTGALGGEPARAGDPPQEPGVVVPGDAGGAGRSGGTLRGAGGERVRPERGEGDRPQGVHPARPAGAREPGRADGGGEQPDRSVPQDAGQRREPAARPAGSDFVVTDPDALHAGGLKQKFRGNVNAIELLRTLETENRPATPEEQATLARYVGWGAMPGAFNKYGESAGDWTKERDEIAALLRPDEFDAAAKSTLNAHFTSGPIVRGMWDMARRLGFDGGRVLEPAMGIGNFFGLMPPDLRGKSDLTGVELDKLTGRIASHLYPRVKVLVHGFEDLKTPAGFFDFAISNVPFGDFRVHDKAYNKHAAPIHDYFFLKSLDQVRPGGLVMFITSTGTMDKGESRIRRALREKADLVAAIRLPEGAFQKNAGTAVVTDLVILKRRPDNTPAGGPEWTNLKTVPDPEGGDPIAINEYFADHPEQVLGTVDRKSRLYRSNLAHVSMTDDFEQRWAAAVARVPEGAFEPRQTPETFKRPPMMAPGTVKEGAYVKGEDGTIRRRKHGELVEQDLTPKQRQIVSATLRVRDALREVINAQVEDRPQAEVDAARKKLNRHYDTFVKLHGPLHKPENAKAFEDDPDAPVVMALEQWDPKTKTAKKADAFRHNTIRGYAKPAKAGNPSEAIGISLNETGRVDIARIAGLLDQTPEQVGKQLVEKGLAFEDPAAATWQSAEQYLCGNVRRKLTEAKEAAKLDEKYRPNVAALEKVQPADVPYDEIDARLGVPWVGPEDLADFAAELFGGDADGFAIKYLPTSGEWLTDYSSMGLRRHRGTPQDTQIYGTSRAGFMDVFEAALNNKVLTIRDRVDKDTTVVNKEESAAANAKVDELQARFRDWIWQDDARRQRLHRHYNDTFNNIAPVRYDGAHLKFPGMSPEITLREHQRNAVWRTIVNGTALYGHEVGTGKTYTMVAAAMELRRLGLARKPAAIVPKDVFPGFVREARELYPSAKMLAVEKFDAKDRKRLISQIATGDYDLVILTHDHSNMLPMKRETQQAFIQREIEELESVIREVGGEDGPSRGKKKSENRLVKKLEKAKARLEARLKEALEGKQDDAITFEETGIDQIFVDEAHTYKSLPVYTKQDRIKGIPTDRSDRATQMWMRTRWLQEMNRGRGVVFATGTPVTNTMAELYTMQRFLQMKELEERGVAAFDAWARNFGVITTRMEYTVTGDYAPNSRFSRFVNLPELARIAGQVVDIQRAKDMPGFKRPKRKDGIVTVPMSAAQRAYLAEIKVRAVEAKSKRPGEKGDNMLSISTDARKSALDMRLVDPRADADDSLKVSRVVESVLRIWTEDPTRTQMIFSDIGVHPTKWGYSAYGAIIDGLVAGGVPREKILNFSDMTTTEKRTASLRLKRGEALVGIGGSKTLGTGVNAQDHLYALHHMDVPWVPAFVEQRDGRGWRQGNRHPTVHIFRYTTEGSFDTFMWQTVDSKSRFIQQFTEAMAGKGKVDRQVADEDGEELSAAQIMAVTSGNPLLLDKINLDRDVSELEGGARRHERNQLRLKDTAAGLARRIAQTREDIARLESNLAAVEAAPDPSGDKFTIELGGRTYTDREKAQEALMGLVFSTEPKRIGTYRGLPIHGRRVLGSDPQLSVGELSAKVSLASIEYAARPSTLRYEIKHSTEFIGRMEQDAAKARAEADRPFTKSEELKKKKGELETILGKMTAQANPPPVPDDAPSGPPRRAPLRSGHVDPTIATDAIKGLLNLPGGIEDALDRAVSKSVGALVRPITGSVSIEGMTRSLAGDAPADAVAAAIHAVKGQLVPMAHVPTTAAAMIREAQVQARYARVVAQDFAKLMTKGGPSKLLGLTVPRELVTGGNMRQMWSVLTGEADVSTLPAELHDLAHVTRATMDKLGQQAVDAGLMSQDTYDRNKGKYLPRMYLDRELENQSAFGAFTRRLRQTLERFKPRLSDAFAIVDDAGRPVSRTDGGFRFDNADARDQYLNVLVRTETLKLARARGAKNVTPNQVSPKGIKTLSDELRPVVAKARRDVLRRYHKVDPLDAETLDRMGLIKEPGYPVSKAFLQLRHDIELAKLFDGIAANAAWVSDVETPGFTKMPDSPSYGDLAGRYVQEDIARELLAMSESPHVAIQMYDAVLRMWKKFKTVLNPATHVRNTLSNMMYFAPLADIDPANVLNLKHYANAVRTMRGSRGPEAIRELYEVGVLGGDFNTNELRDALRGVKLDLADHRGPIDMLRGILGGIDRTISGAYRLEDDIFKVAAYLKQRERGATPREAAAHVYKWLPDYSQQPTSATVKVAKRTILPFGTFLYESIRIGANGLREKPITMLRLAAIPALITAYSAHALGLDDDDRDAIEKQTRGPVFSALMPFMDDQGRPVVLDLSNVNPWAGVLGERFDLPGSRGEATVMEKVGKFLVNSNPASTIAVGLGVNEDPFSGRRLRQSGMTTREKLFEQGKFIGKTLLPPLTPKVGSSAQKIGTSVDVSRSSLMRPDLSQTVLRAVAGIDLRSAAPSIPRMIDDFLRLRGRSLVDPPDDSTPASRRRRDLHQAVLNEDQRAFREAMLNILHAEERTPTPVELLKMIESRHPLRRVKIDDRAAFLDGLSKLEREQVDRTLEEFKKTRPRGLKMLKAYDPAAVPGKEESIADLAKDSSAARAYELVGLMDDEEKRKALPRVRLKILRSEKLSIEEKRRMSRELSAEAARLRGQQPAATAP